MAEEQLRDIVIEFPQARLTAGGRLRAAREAAALSLADMAGLTKIPVRMLTLIEAGDYAALPAKAYATGFTRTYARALGLDEQEVLAEVRRELGHTTAGEARTAPTFEPGDPARVPSARFAWAAAVAALVVLIAGLLLWRSYYAPAVTLPPLAQPSAPAAAAPPAAPAPVAMQLVPVPGAEVSGATPAGPPAITPGPSAPARPMASTPGNSAPLRTTASTASAPVAAAGAAPAPASTASF